jgi:hypothetical protein
LKRVKGKRSIKIEQNQKENRMKIKEKRENTKGKRIR